MQIVINIPDPAYRGIIKADHAGGNWSDDLLGVLCRGVANGTPLPTGHGRLIDADRFINDYACCGYIEDMDVDYFRTVIPTIIEADAEREGANDQR